MKWSNWPIGAFLLAFCFSCKPNEPDLATTNDHHPKVEVSTTFQPAEFVVDDRMEQIAAIRPQLHQLFEEYRKERNIPGIAYGIVVDNQLVIDSAVGYINVAQELPVHSHACFRIASMTKSFTAMAIMKLVEEGRLGLQDPVVQYIPEVSKIPYLTSDATIITIEHLLTMTAGFPEDNPWGDRQLDETDDMLSALIAGGLSLSNPPAHAYEYSNTGYAMLGLIIKKVSGMPYQTYITQNILEPLGMQETYWEYEEVPVDQLVLGYDRQGDRLTVEPLLHDGSYGSMGGLITSIADFSKYVSFHLSAWPPRSTPDDGPVKRSSLRKMHQPQYVRLIADAKDWNDEPCPVISGYGYGLRIGESCKNIRRVSHGGALPGFGSHYVFYPDLGIGLMAFCNVTYTSPWPYVELLKLLFEEIKLKPRKLPTSEILLTRQKQIVDLIQSWDSPLGNEILAENFYLDESKAARKAAIDQVFDEAGTIVEVGQLTPLNQLRGSFPLIAEKDTITVYFTLTPEPQKKVQYLELAIQ